MLKPVMMINIICIANPSKSKKPLYHDFIISKGVAPSQAKALIPVIKVNNIAKTNALGMYFRNICVNFSPNFLIMCYSLNDAQRTGICTITYTRKYYDICVIVSISIFKISYAKVVGEYTLLGLLQYKEDCVIFS